MTRCRIIVSGVPFATDVPRAPAWFLTPPLWREHHPDGALRSTPHLATTASGTGRALEFQVRDARLTDIERISALLERVDPRWASAELSQAADLLRQLVYLPNAAVLVATEERSVVGVAVLALRPSVATGGLVGALDVLAVEPGSGADEIAAALLHEVIRSAGNKGCSELEVTLADDPTEFAHWRKLGFEAAGQRLTYALARVPTRAR
jgi:N-acetylglutamate synthase-like GNAT family acetyltransferase